MTVSASVHPGWKCGFRESPAGETAVGHLHEVVGRLLLIVFPGQQLTRGRSPGAGAIISADDPKCAQWGERELPPCHSTMLTPCPQQREQASFLFLVSLKYHVSKCLYSTSPHNICIEGPVYLREGRSEASVQDLPLGFRDTVLLRNGRVLTVDRSVHHPRPPGLLN